MMNLAGMMAPVNNMSAEKTQGSGPLKALSAEKEKDGDFASLLSRLSVNEESDEKANEMLNNLLQDNPESIKPLMMLLEDGESASGEILTDLFTLENSEELLEKLMPHFNREDAVMFASEGYEDILTQLTDLLEELAAEETALDTEVLTNAEAEELLQELPSDWREALTAMFEEEASFAELTDELAENGDPLALLAMLMQTDELEGDAEAINSEGQAVLMQTLEQFAAKMFGLKESAPRSQERPVLKDIKLFFQTSRSNESQPATFQEMKKPDSTSASRYSELAYLKQTAQNSAQGQTINHGSALMLESTNSQLARFQHFMSASGETQPQQMQTEKTSQDQLMRQFQNLLSRSSFQQMNNGLQQLTIKLHPESLGRLDVQLQQVNGMMTAKLMTSTQGARELLEGQVQSLRNAFQAQNIQVDKIEITQQQTNQLLKDQEQSSSEKEEPESDQTPEDPEEDTLDFSEFLQETLEDEGTINEEI